MKGLRVVAGRDRHPLDHAVHDTVDRVAVGQVLRGFGDEAQVGRNVNLRAIIRHRQVGELGLRATRNHQQCHRQFQTQVSHS